MIKIKFQNCILAMTAKENVLSNQLHMVQNLKNNLDTFNGSAQVEI